METLPVALTDSTYDFEPVQVVNFANPLSGSTNPGPEAVRLATSGLVGTLRLRVVTLPFLIALKLFAGGPKSRLDVLALLEVNPEAPLEEIRKTCRRFGLGREWRTVLAQRAR